MRPTTLLATLLLCALAVAPAASATPFEIGPHNPLVSVCVDVAGTYVSVGHHTVEHTPSGIVVSPVPSIDRGSC